MLWNWSIILNCWEFVFVCCVVRNFKVIVAQWLYLVHWKGGGEYQKYALILETWNHDVDIEYNIVFDELI